MLEQVSGGFDGFGSAYLLSHVLKYLFMTLQLVQLFEQVSGGFGGFGSAAIAGSDAAKQLPMGPPGGRGGAGGSSGGVSSAPGWGDDGSGGVRSMARLSATQLDSLRRDAGLPSVKSLSSDQQVPVYLVRQIAVYAKELLSIPKQSPLLQACPQVAVLRPAVSIWRAKKKCFKEPLEYPWDKMRSCGSAHMF